jgi:hypothetical protein
MITIDASSVFASEPGVEVSEVPDGYVIYQAGRDRVHFLNPTAVAVYELCAEGMTVGEIEQYLQDKLGLQVAPGAMVEECIRQLLSEALIREGTSGKAA